MDERAFYVGISECGCVSALLVDDKITTAKEIAEFARRMQRSKRRMEHRRVSMAECHEVIQQVPTPRSHPMTRQMADDEVLAVLNCAAETLDREADGSAGLREAIAAVAALQAERDALRACDESMQQTNYELHQQIREHKAALEALRGQVEGLVDAWHSRERLDESDAQWMREKTYEQCADELAELLAIKERMA